MLEKSIPDLPKRDIKCNPNSTPHWSGTAEFFLQVETLWPGQRCETATKTWTRWALTRTDVRNGSVIWTEKHTAISTDVSTWGDGSQKKKRSTKANAYPWILLQECVRYRPGTRRHINGVGGLMDKDKKKRDPCRSNTITGISQNQTIILCPYDGAHQCTDTTCSGHSQKNTPLSLSSPLRDKWLAQPY